MHTVEIAACPVCSGGLAPLGISENYTVKALRARITVEYAICKLCAFVCQSRVLSLDALMRYYRDSPKLREAIPTATDRSLHLTQATFMKRAGELAGKRVLDIGADMGKFLDHLADGYGCKTFYQEENQTARAWLQSSGRHVDAGNIDAFVPFDWIVLSQVLEHIIDPIPLLETLRTRLTASGRLFIEVPNHGVWDELDIGFFFEHVNYFSPATLTAALDRAGFHLLTLEVTTDSHYFDGRCRIIRACAQPRAANLVADAAAVVRDHERKHKAVRADAIVALNREYEQSDKVPVALYGAAQLADLVLDAVTAAGGHIAAIFDSDVRKHGQSFGPLSIATPTRIVEVNPSAIVILSSAEADIRATIEASGYAGRIICWSDL